MYRTYLGNPSLAAIWVGRAVCTQPCFRSRHNKPVISALQRRSPGRLVAPQKISPRLYEFFMNYGVFVYAVSSAKNSGIVQPLAMGEEVALASAAVLETCSHPTKENVPMTLEAP
jgi:hypothetical protein